MRWKPWMQSRVRVNHSVPCTLSASPVQHQQHQVQNHFRMTLHLLSCDAGDLYSMTIFLDSLLHIIILHVYEVFHQGISQSLTRAGFLFLKMSLYKNTFHVLTPLLYSIVEAIFNRYVSFNCLSLPRLPEFLSALSLFSQGDCRVQSE